MSIRASGDLEPEERCPDPPWATILPAAASGYIQAIQPARWSTPPPATTWSSGWPDGWATTWWPDADRLGLAPLPRPATAHAGAAGRRNR